MYTYLALQTVLEEQTTHAHTHTHILKRYCNASPCSCDSGYMHVADGCWFAVHVTMLTKSHGEDTAGLEKGNVWKRNQNEETKEQHTAGLMSVT